MLPIRAKNDARRGLSPFLTGAFKFMPCFLADARPAAFKPPDGFLPSDLCQAGVLATRRSHIVNQVGVWAASFLSCSHSAALFGWAKTLWFRQSLRTFFVPDFFSHYLPYPLPFFLGIVFFLCHFGFHVGLSYPATSLPRVFFSRLHASLAVSKVAGLTVLGYYLWHLCPQCCLCAFIFSRR